MENAPSVAEVVDALGGSRVVADVAGVGVTAVINWRAWNCFPPRLYLPLRDFARHKRVRIPEVLFRQRSAAEADATAPTPRPKKVRAA